METTNATPISGEWPAEPKKVERECSRCRGYLGDDYCIDIFSDTGEVAVAVLRCTQCGRLLDPVILPHRFKGGRVAA